MSKKQSAQPAAASSTTSLPAHLTPRATSPTGSIASSTADSISTAPEQEAETLQHDLPSTASTPTLSLSLQRRAQNVQLRTPSRSPARRKMDPDEPWPAFLWQPRAEIVTKFKILENDSLKVAEKHAEELKELQPYGDKVKEVAIRNRYANVEVWHHNRIILQVEDGESDYINASRIILKRDADDKVGAHYIATQGPKDVTISHFWQMAWQESGSPVVMIMLTKTMENFREKCYDYLPTEADIPVGTEGVPPKEPKYTILPGTRVDREELGCVYREFTVRREQDGSEKKVMHYAFEEWPDFGVPVAEDRKKLLALIRETNNLAVRHPASPRIVHCSAGVGRTGTFMALDFLLTLLKEGRLQKSVVGEEDMILRIVKDLRQQRMLMVQSESQFTMLYEILREETQRA